MLEFIKMYCLDKINRNTHQSNFKFYFTNGNYHQKYSGIKCRRIIRFPIFFFLKSKSALTCKFGQNDKIAKNKKIMEFFFFRNKSYQLHSVENSVKKKQKNKIKSQSIMVFLNPTKKFDTKYFFFSFFYKIPIFIYSIKSGLVLLLRSKFIKFLKKFSYNGRLSNSRFQNLTKN